MRKALIVGIDNYPNSPLRGCVNDAVSLADVMEVHGDGSPNFSVKLAVNTASKSTLKSLIVELFQGDNDTALFYFSGHGYVDHIGGYIVTPDFKNYDVGVSMDEILTIANGSKTKNKIIILDCCHSGAFGSPGVLGGAFTQIIEGVTVLTASKGEEVAVELNGHGIFTNLLLSALEGGAADVLGYITPGSVYAYIDQSLGVWHKQRPVFKTNITRFTLLRTIRPQVPIGMLRNIIKYFPSPVHEYALDPSYEETNSKSIKHKIIEPYAKPENTRILKELQKLESVGLVVPVNADHMYFASMESKSCLLTPLGRHYWNLVKEKKI